MCHGWHRGGGVLDDEHEHGEWMERIAKNQIIKLNTWTNSIWSGRSAAMPKRNEMNLEEGVAVSRYYSWPPPDARSESANEICMRLSGNIHFW